MPQLEVMLEVPQQIAKGLASGQLERVGGVVRDSSSKQVVAWLREGGRIMENSDLAGGTLKALFNASTGGIPQTATGILTSAATAKSHFLIMQELQGLTNLVNVVGGIGVLNLVATIVSTALILRKLSELELAIEELVEHVSNEFSQDRKVKMETAIHAAQEALEMVHKENKRDQANAALWKLFEARQHIWLEIESAKGGSDGASADEIMQNNILQAMQLDMLRCRCFMEINELPLAKRYLDGKLNDYGETTRHLVHRHLGSNRALYFHKDIPESDLRRYLAIEFWLRPDEDRLLQIVLANRHDFWNAELVKKSNITASGSSAFFSRPMRNKEPETDHTLLDALRHCELLIENHRRFLGFYAEVEAIERLGISQADLESQQEESLKTADINLAEHDDYVLLVESEGLESFARQSA